MLSISRGFCGRGAGCDNKGMFDDFANTELPDISPTPEAPSKVMPVPQNSGSLTGALMDKPFRLWTEALLDEIKTQWTPEEQRAELFNDFALAWQRNGMDHVKAMKEICPGISDDDARSKGRGLIKILTQSQNFQDIRKLIAPNQLIASEMTKILTDNFDAQAKIKAAKLLLEAGVVNTNQAPRVTINVLGQLKSSIQQLPDEMINVTSRVSSKEENIIDIETLLSDKPASE